MGVFGDIGGGFKELGSDVWGEVKDAWGGLSDWLNGDRDPSQARLEDRDQLKGWIESQFAGDQAAPQAQHSEEWRQRQMQLADRLNAIGTGQQMGPAELAVQRQAARANAQQQGMAGMARGLNSIGAGRQAARNSARIGVDAAGQARQAGMNDRLMADQTLMGVLSSARGADQQTMLANLDAQMRQRGLNSQQRQAAIQQLLGMNMSEMEGRLGMTEGSMWGPALALGGSALAAISDKRAKENIEDATLEELLESVDAFTYDYKDEKHGKGRQVGVMAQDLEKTELGKFWVEDTEEGHKRVNYGKAAGAILAAASKLHKEVNGG